MTTTVFADRLRNAMIDRGMKQIDLVHAAERSGVKMGKSHISQYVAGKTMPREDVLDFLAGELKVDAAWLRGDLRGSANDVVTVLGPGTSMPSSANGADAIDPESTADTDPIVEPFPEPTHAVRPVDDAAVTSSETGSNGSAASPDGSPSSPALGSPTPRRRTFGKSHKLDHVLYDVRGPVVDEAARMEADGTHILKLNIGNPAPFGFRTPDEVVYDMAHQLTETEGYSPSKGLFSARKAIMQYAQLKNLPNVTIDDIYTGNGVSELINLCMSALLDDGDEVLIPSPDYPLWTACATLAGGTPVHYLCDEQAEWYPDMDDIRAKVTPHTKAIVIINPNNPTGALYPREVLQEIVDIARENQLMIFSDEIYDRLVMDGLEHVSIASLAPDLPCVTFSGLSKSHMIAGYRIGWMVLSGNLRCMHDFMLGVNMLSNMRLCSNVPAQSIVQTALWGHQSVKDYLVPGGRIFEQRECVYEGLNAIDGITAVKPRGAFYIFPKIDTEKFGITDDEQFALDLLHDKHILIVPGKGFNWGKPDHFRVVYLPRRRVLRECMEDLADFLATYRQN